VLGNGVGGEEMGARGSELRVCCGGWFGDPEKWTWRVIVVGECQCDGFWMSE
jgi:hypothetical protein